MKYIFKILTIIISIIFIVFTIFILFNNKSKIEINENFNSSKEEIFEYFVDLKKFNKWNFWTMKDPLVELYYFYPYKGEKSSFKWKSLEKDVESGNYTIKQVNNNNWIKSEFFFDSLKIIIPCTIKFKSISNKKTKIIWIFYHQDNSIFNKIFNFQIENDLKKKIKFSFHHLKKEIYYKRLK